MYSEQSSKVNGPSLSLNVNGNGKGKNALQWREGGKRAGPYTPRLKYSPADPEAPGKWGHDLFGQQIQGGNLAFRLQMDRGPSAAEAKIAARNGGRGGSSSGGGGAGGGQDLMDASFDLLGRRPQQQQRQQQQQQQQRQQQAAAREPRATRTADAEMQDEKPRASKPISILGSSGKTWVLVSNLVAGTTAEDVKTTFDQFGAIIAAKDTPAPRGTVSVLLQFKQFAAAQDAIKTFDAQIADGRPISVALHQPAPPPPAPPAPAPVPTPRTYPSERERERPSAPAARPAAAPRASSLSSRIAGVPSNGGGKGAAGGGLFERLGLATNRPPAPRGPPPARRAGPTAAAGFGEGGGDLMDMFGDSKMRSEQMAEPASSRTRSGRGGRGGRSGQGGSSASRVRGVGGMDVD